MKKLLVLLLALAVVFSLASCDLFKLPEAEHTVHTDENDDGFCDGCGAIFIDYSQPSIVGDALMESLEKQFDEMKSLKFEFNAKTLSESDSWYYDEHYDDELGEWVNNDTPNNHTYYSESVATLELWLSITDDGVNAKIITNSGYRSSTLEDMELDNENVTYIVDGYAYTQLHGTNFNKSVAVPEELTALLEELGSLDILDEAEKEELLTELGVEIATVFNILDNKGSYSLDLKPAVDKLLTYIDELDMDEDTIGGVIDDVLKQVSPDLTSAKILAEAKRFAGLTVEEALDELDKWLTENYETTLQGLYDSLLADPEALSAIEWYLENAGIATDKDEVDEIIKEMKSFKLREVLKEEGVDQLVIFDELIAPQLPPYSTDPETGADVYITSEEFFGYVQDLLDMTLAEFDEMTGGGSVFTSLKEIASSFTINKLNAKIDLNFEGVLSLVSVDGEVNFDVEQNRPSEVEGKNDFNRAALSISFKLSEISANELDVSLPKGIKIFEDTTYTSGSDSVSVNYYSSSYNDVETIRASFNFTLYDEDGNKYEFYTSCDIDGTSNSFYNEDISSLYINDEWCSLNDEISFTLNPANKTFTITEMPNFDRVGGTFYSGEDRVHLSYYEYDGSLEVNLSFYLYDDYGNEIYLYESFTIDEASNEYTFVVDYFYFNDEYYYFDYDNEQSLTVVFDRATMSFTITEMPDWSLALN